jgi:hypothetical protein
MDAENIERGIEKLETIQQWVASEEARGRQIDPSDLGLHLAELRRLLLEEHPSG